jgi:hypothetical protein
LLFFKIKKFLQIAFEIKSNFDSITLKCFSPQNIVNEFINSGETHEDDHELDKKSSNKETELLAQVIVRKLLDGKNLFLMICFIREKLQNL